MNRVVPWVAFVDLVSRYAPEGKKGHPPFPLEAMLRIHFMHVWSAPGDRQGVKGASP
jgi:IS5 family transposase